MHILFDHGTPAPLRSVLTGRTVREAKAQGWDTYKNGDLLLAAEAAGFDVLVTTDKNMRYQQNLSERAIAIVVLGNAQWPVLRWHVAHVVAAVDAATPASVTEVASWPLDRLDRIISPWPSPPARASASTTCSSPLGKAAWARSGGRVTPS